MQTITIASIQTNAPKMGTVQTTDGRKINFWKSELGKLGLQGNGTYEVETEPWHEKTLITKAKLVAAPPPVAASSTPHTPANGGGMNGASHYRPTSPEDAERMFVCATLTALIRAGEVKNDKQQLWDATNMLRQLWKHTFGFSVFTPGEAGRKVA